jgi:hypothetical protein
MAEEKRTENNIQKYNTEGSINKINKIISKFKIYSFQKKVKKLIQMHKENYTIISSLKESNLKLVIYFHEKQKEYQVAYDSILCQTIAYVPRSDCQNILLLKFYFLNEKNENIIDPKYNNEYNEIYHMFLNVLNLKKLLDKEEDRKEDFQTFLETYFTSNEISKEIRKYFLNSTIRKTNKRRTFVIKGSLNLKKIGNKVKSEEKLVPILKKRQKHRIPSGKRISFGNVMKIVYYTQNI